MCKSDKHAYRLQPLPTNTAIQPPWTVLTVQHLNIPNCSPQAAEISHINASHLIKQFLSLYILYNKKTWPVGSDLFDAILELGRPHLDRRVLWCGRRSFCSALMYESAHEQWACGSDAARGTNQNAEMHFYQYTPPSKGSTTPLRVEWAVRADLLISSGGSEDIPAERSKAEFPL